MEKPIILGSYLMRDEAREEAFRKAFLTIAGRAGETTGETANAEGESLIKIILAFLQR
jgi:hypothetical protein